MYNAQVAKEARDMMYYTYIAMIVLGALMVLGSLSSILAGIGLSFFFGFGLVAMAWGLLWAAVGVLGIYTAMTKIQPQVIAKIDQGKYQEAYVASSSTTTLIISFLTGIIPGILLILGNQKLSQLAGPAVPPPPPA